MSPPEDTDKEQLAELMVEPQRCASKVTTKGTASRADQAQGRGASLTSMTPGWNRVKSVASRCGQKWSASPRSPATLIRAAQHARRHQKPARRLHHRRAQRREVSQSHPADPEQVRNSASATSQKTGAQDGAHPTASRRKRPHPRLSPPCPGTGKRLAGRTSEAIRQDCRCQDGHKWTRPPSPNAKTANFSGGNRQQLSDRLAWSRTGCRWSASRPGASTSAPSSTIHQRDHRHAHDKRQGGAGVGGAGRDHGASRPHRSSPMAASSARAGRLPAAG